VLVTREPRFIENALMVEFDGADEGFTAIFGIGREHYYRSIKKRKCELEVEKIKNGVITLTVVKDSETKPTYVCDEMYAVVNGEEICVSGNFLEYDKLLAEQRCEIDELRADNALFKAELLQFRDEFDEIYKGYKVL
jgi:uncharacterized protein YacL (UPF0231 family)